MQAWCPWQPAQRPSCQGPGQACRAAPGQARSQAPAGIAGDADAPSPPLKLQGPSPGQGKRRRANPAARACPADSARSRRPPCVRPFGHPVRPGLGRHGAGRPAAAAALKSWPCATGNPWHHGPVRLLLGPERLEGAWWSSAPATHPEHQATALQREYWVAHSPAGLMWVFQEADDPAQSGGLPPLAPARLVRLTPSQVRRPAFVHPWRLSCQTAFPTDPATPWPHPTLLMRRRPLPATRPPMPSCGAAATSSFPHGASHPKSWSNAPMPWAARPSP